MVLTQNNNLSELNVLFLGTSQVGKSTLINKILGKEVNIKTNKNNKSVTQAIIYYNYENFKLIDAPGIYDDENNSYEKSWYHIRKVLLQVNKVDYIILCISASKHEIRDIDITTLSVLNNFKYMKDRVFIYITKSDLLDNTQYNNFMNKYRLNNYFKDMPTFIGYNNHSLIYKKDNLYDNSNMFNFMTYEHNRLQKDEIDDLFHVPLINNIQKYMVNNNLYPLNYNNYISNWFTRLFNYGKTYNVFDNYDKIFSFNIKLIELKNVNDKNSIINTIIYYDYDDINKFYEGSLYGNKFHIGTFYFKSGEILYEKNC